MEARRPNLYRPQKLIRETINKNLEVIDLARNMIYNGILRSCMIYVVKLFLVYIIK